MANAVVRVPPSQKRVRKRREYNAKHKAHHPAGKIRADDLDVGIAIASGEKCRGED